MDGVAEPERGGAPCGQESWTAGTWYWTDPTEIENLGVPHYTPGEALQILLRAFVEGWIAQAPPVEPAEPLEQLKLPLRAA